MLWAHHAEFNANSNAAPDVFIAWRYPISLILGRSSPKRLLWLHDLLPASSLPSAVVPWVDAVLVPSSFQLNALPGHLVATAHVLPNCLSAEYFIDGPNRDEVFVFASSPDRGLRETLLLWPAIRSAVVKESSGLPSVSPELHVYYGLRPSVLKAQQRLLGTQGAAAWESEIRTLLSQTGVVYHGSVDHETLTTEFASAGFLLYPTRFPETGCITAMRAMALGAIPITSRYEGSALFNLTRGFDLGPLEALRDVSDSSYSGWLEQQWLPAVLSAALAPPDDLRAHRSLMKSFARSKFTWNVSAALLAGIVTKKSFA